MIASIARVGLPQYIGNVVHEDNSERMEIGAFLIQNGGFILIIDEDGRT
jgi:hypothetical protein